jgi:hypothetical protein
VGVNSGGEIAMPNRMFVGDSAGATGGFYQPENIPLRLLVPMNKSGCNSALN